MRIVNVTRTAYKKPFPIATVKIELLEPLCTVIAEVIALTYMRMVIARNSAMHPRSVLKKIFGLQKRNLFRCVVVINWRDSSGVWSYWDDSNIVTIPTINRVTLYCGIMDLHSAKAYTIS